MKPIGATVRTLALAAALASGLAPSVEAAPDPTCPSCKRWVASEWRFCPFDGAGLKAETPATPASPAPVPPPTPAPAAAPSPAPAPASAPAPAPPTPTAAAPSLAGALSTPTAEVFAPPVRKIPTETIDDLFAAIIARNDAALRHCYRWEVFFATTPPEAREAKITDYLARLTSRVRPSLEGRDRLPGSIRLTANEADLQFMLRDHQSRAIIATYEFKLTRADDGWKIIGIRP